jgi:hypothetical protein
MQSNRSISIHQDPFLPRNQKIADALTQHDKEVLERLHRGLRHGLNLERINGARRNVVTIRPDGKRRLFLWMSGNLIVVMHIMENHKHDNVDMKALEKSTMEFIFGRALEDDFELTYEPTDEIPDFIPDEKFELKEIKSATCYNQNLIVYDDNQELVLANPLPVLLHGDFGSGKSALARTMLINAILQFKDVYPDKDFVYYSHLPDLVRYMQDQFLLDNPNIGTQIDLDRVKFLDTQGLVREYGPSLELVKKNPVGMVEFKAFLVEQHKNEVSKLKRKQTSPLTDINVNADCEVIYDEFQIITGMPSEKAYLALGSQASNYAHPDIRKWLFGLVKLYEDRMKSRNEYDPCLKLWKVEETPLAFLVGDEMQGAPFSVVEMAARLVEGKNIMFCCDSNQSERRLSALPRIKTIFKQYKAPLNVCTMPGSYRSPAHMMPLINTVIRIKQHVHGGLHDKHQAPVVDSKAQPQSHQGDIQWGSLLDVEGIKNKLNDRGVLYVVITPEAYVDDAKKAFGDGVPVYTPRQARGMEFAVVVFYRLMDEPLPVKNKQKTPILLSTVINDLIAGLPLKSDPAKHQPKPGKANPLYEPKLNDWVIALSRLVGGAAHCFMIEAFSKQQAGRLQAFIKLAIEEGQALIKNGGQGLVAGTPAEWEAFALKNIEMGNREQAWVAYRHLGKTEAELDAAIQLYQKNKQARVDRALAASVPVVDRAQFNIDKAEKTWAYLTKAKDKSSALIKTLKEKRSHEFLMLPLKTGRPVFLEIMGNSELAKGFYLVLMKNDNKVISHAIAALFSRCEWFKPYDNDDQACTRLHWMLEDNVRLLILTSAIKLIDGKPLPGFDDDELLTKWLAYYVNRDSKVKLSVIASLVVNQLGEVIRLFPNYPMQSAVYKAMRDEKTREFFFKLLVEFFDYEAGSRESIILDRIMTVILLSRRSPVQFSTQVIPLIYTIFLSEHSRKIGAYIERNSRRKDEFYKENLDDPNHLGTPIYMPKYNGCFPILYALAKESSPQFSILAVMAKNAGFAAAFYLMPWKGQGQVEEGESILSALLANLVDADQGDTDKLLALDAALSTLISLDDSNLVKIYIDRYVRHAFPIPAVSENAKNPRALFDACFYLAYRFHARFFISAYDNVGSLLLEALSREQLFARVAIHPSQLGYSTTPMPLLFYVAHRESMFSALKTKFSKDSLEDRLSYLPDLYQALSVRDVNALTVGTNSFNAFSCLVNTWGGVEFLHDLMVLFPGLAALIKAEDFTEMEGKNFNLGLGKMCETGYGYNDFLDLIFKENKVLYRKIYEANQWQVTPHKIRVPSDAIAKPDPLMLDADLPQIKTSLNEYFERVAQAPKKRDILMILIERIPASLWAASIEGEPPFFIKIVGHEASAKELLSLMAEGKQPLMAKFMTELAINMEWLRGHHDEQHKNYRAEIHWMIEDDLRLAIFKKLIEAAGTAPLQDFDNQKALGCFTMHRESKKMRTKLPLISMLVICEMDLFRRILSANPGLLPLVGRCLLLDFTVNNQTTNTINYIQNHGSEAQKKHLEALLSENNHHLYYRIIKAGAVAPVEKCDPKQVNLAVAWCLDKMKEANGLGPVMASPLLANSVFNGGSGSASPKPDSQPSLTRDRP